MTEQKKKKEELKEKEAKNYCVSMSCSIFIILFIIAVSMHIVSLMKYLKFNIWNIKDLGIRY